MTRTDAHALAHGPFQTRFRTQAAFVLCVVCTTALVGCGNEDSAKQAPQTESLEAPEQPAAAAPSTAAFNVDATSDVTFLMEAPVENIRGRAPNSVSGALSFNLTDLTQSSGLIKIDLDELTVYQTTRDDADAEWGEETKNDVQNEHMKNWLQISADAPAEMREANRYIEFRMNTLETPSQADVTAMDGAERTVTALVQGDFRLHGRTAAKTARVELTFVFEGDTAKSVRVRSLEPVAVSLVEHEVQPRETFAKLAQKALSDLGAKVSDTAPVTFSFSASS